MIVPEKPDYTYRAKMEKVVDGDTFDFKVDLGFNVSIRMRVRLANVDAFEVRGEEKLLGLKAKEFVLNAIPVGAPVIIRTKKDSTGKYGRYIAEVFYRKKIDNEFSSLGEDLIGMGLAERYKYE